MKKQYYLPTELAKRVIWLDNLAQKLPTYAASLGLTPGEVTSVVAMSKFYAYIIGIILQSKTFTQQLTQFKNTLSTAPFGTVLGPVPTLTLPAAPPVTAAGIFTVIGGLIVRMKASNNYTDAIGQDLKIIGDEVTFDPNTFVPALKGNAMPSFVNLTFVKDHTDGMNIYTRVQGRPDWVFLGLDTESPYHDTRPLAVANTPEVREYRCRGVIHDAEIGQWSDIVSVTFAG